MLNILLQAVVVDACVAVRSYKISDYCGPSGLPEPPKSVIVVDSPRHSMTYLCWRTIKHGSDSKIELC